MNLYNVRQKFKNYSSPLPDLVWFIHHPECTREVSAIQNSLKISGTQILHYSKSLLIIIDLCSQTPSFKALYERLKLNEEKNNIER